MAPKRLAIGAFVLGFAMVLGGAMAQSGCTSTIISMASCLNYVSGSATAPSSSCCSALASVVRTRPECLCIIVNGGGASFGVTINQTRALNLPQVCNVQTPPVSRCNSVNGTAMSPVGSPQSSFPGIGNGIPGSETGSGPTSSNGSSSNGSITTINIQLVAIVFLVSALFSPTLKNFF